VEMTGENEQEETVW